MKNQIHNPYPVQDANRHDESRYQDLDGPLSARNPRPIRGIGSAGQRDRVGCAGGGRGGGSAFALLSADEKKLIAGLFDGGAKADAKAGDAPKKKLSIMADSILCKASNVDLTARSCEIIFKTGKRASFKGREANEVFATLAMAGVTPEGAAGSMIENVSKLNCTLDPGAINDKSGGGAECSFRTGE